MRTFRILIPLILFVALTRPAGAGFPVVIDTDAAADDLRALCLMFAIEDADILAIVTSDGALSPAEGVAKVRALLETLGRQSVPTASGHTLSITPPPWRKLSRQISWGTEEITSRQGKPGAGPGAARLIAGCIRNAQEPVTMICLGPLTNVADAIKFDPGVTDGIARIVWYNDAIAPASGTNYARDSESADFVLSVPLDVDVISNVLGVDTAANTAGTAGGAPEFSATTGTAPVFDEALLQRIEAIHSTCSQRIAWSHGRAPVIELVRGGHLRLWDDLIPVYLHRPGLFEMTSAGGTSRCRISTSFSAAGVKEEIVAMLAGQDEHEGVVLKDIPDAPELFSDDLEPLVQQIIERHGLAEWRSCVLTSELHRHLGIYSVLGVKMGLRAREFFAVPLDQLTVVSYAGSTPPVSCMNDGLQVSTGATMGHGTIRVLDDAETGFRQWFTGKENYLPGPAASFNCGGRVVLLRLKPDCWKQIRDDVASGIKEHGDLTPAYFEHIRDLAIRYWLELDRNEIFDIVETE